MTDVATQSPASSRPDTDWTLLLQQAQALMSVTRDPIANAANLCALLYQELGEVNWAGFYLVRDGRLVLGPFQGLPACVDIPLGSGVCGTAAATGKIQRVADVHAFEGHIACDANSESEIVLPLIAHGAVIGVLDLDSPVPDRFAAADEAGLSAIADAWLDAVDLP
jgi:GAF domain-containing protein